jgi:hypothetical protein
MKMSSPAGGALGLVLAVALVTIPRPASCSTLAEQGAAGTFLSWTDVNITKPMMCDATHPLEPGMYRLALFTFPDNSVRVVFYLAGVEKGRATGMLQRVPLNLDAHRFLFTLQGQQWRMRIGDSGQDQALINLQAAPGTALPGFKGFVKPPKIGGAPAKPH